MTTRVSLAMVLAAKNVLARLMKPTAVIPFVSRRLRCRRVGKGRRRSRQVHVTGSVPSFSPRSTILAFSLPRPCMC